MKKTTITIDTTKVTPTVYLFQTHAHFVEWLANQTNKGSLATLEVAKSGTYEYTESHLVRPSHGEKRWVYAYTFDTPQMHPRRFYTFTTWAVIANSENDQCIKVNR